MIATLRRILVIGALVSATAPLCAADAPSITMMPFENASGAVAAPAEIGPRVAKAAIARGWRITDADIRPLLEQQRVRYFDSLEGDARRKVLEATGGSALLSGTIYTYVEGRNPVVALAARLVAADGTLLWSQVTAASSDEEEAVFGLRRAADPRALTDDAVASLIRTFPRAGSKAQQPRGPSSPLFLGRVSAYRAEPLAPMHSTSGARRICVLPFENQSKNPAATRIVHDTLVVRLAADPTLEVVDPAVLRAAARTVRIGSFRGITNADLLRVGREVGATLFVQGTIYEFVESAGTARDPEIDLEMSIVDVTAERVVWAGQHDRRGSDYTGLFLLGAATNGVALTDRVVTEMTEAKARRSPRAAQAFVAARLARNAKKKPAETTSELGPSRKGGEDKK